VRWSSSSQTLILDIYLSRTVPEDPVIAVKAALHVHSHIIDPFGKRRDLTDRDSVGREAARVPGSHLAWGARCKLRKKFLEWPSRECQSPPCTPETQRSSDLASLRASKPASPKLSFHSIITSILDDWHCSYTLLFLYRQGSSRCLAILRARAW